MKKQCAKNRVHTYIRVALSLLIIGLGIVYKNWVGAFGVITLLSALTGDCAFSFTFRKPTTFRLKDRETQSDNLEN